MFARVLDEMKEPFTGPPSSSDTKGMLSIQNYFSNTLPNVIYNNDPKLNVASLTEVSNTRISSNQDTLRQKWVQADNNKKLLEQKEADCKDSKGLDPFDHLTQLNANEDQTSRLRCGWIYNKTNPVLGGGALGLKEGPISSKAPGVWNWNLKLATEQMHVDICKDIQNCTDIDRLSLKKRCGWCERLQKGVPISKNGKVAYPWNKTGGCPGSVTITSGSMCPANPPGDEDEETVPEPCDPLPDGRISRACVLSKYKDAGCSDNGAIGRALAKGTDNDYMNSLYSQKAYKIYQERNSLSLNEYALKSGKISINDTLNEFDRLASAASKAPSGGNALNFATRDLCLKQGELDAFDFCTELRDSSVGPYSLDCLQKAFIRAGGQKNGLMYPSPSSMSRWNSLPNWRAVLSEIQRVKNDAGSNDSDVRFNGTKQFVDANTPDPFTCGSKLLPRNIRLSRGNVVGRFTMTQDYKLEFNVTPKGIVGGWGSLFHFSADGNNCCEFGQRSPAIWFFPGSLTLHIRIGDSDEGNWGVDLNGCALNKKSNIIIFCQGKNVTITIDGVTHTRVQPTYRYSGPITVFASDPWHDIPNALVENVCFQTLGNSTPLSTCATTVLPRKVNLSRGNVIGRFTMSQDYKFEFDILPRGIVGGWGSLFHFSSNGNNCCTLGERSPAIWFFPGGLTLHIRIGDSTDGNWGVDINGCAINKRTKVIVHCVGKSVRVSVGGTTHSFTQPTFLYSGPVQVFASDPWHDIPNAVVDNICLELLGNSTVVPVGPFKINIGNSGQNEKVVSLPGGIPPAFRNIKVLSQGYSDDFVSRIDGNRLIVRRVDNFSGWGANYTAEITEGVQPHMSNIAFVRIEGGSVLNMSQLVVLDEYGNNISRGRPQQVNSETYGDANRTKANDGGEAPRPHPQEYHGRGADDLWQIQLDGLKKVSAVIVYNRSDCCQDRMASGFVIKLYAPRPTGGYTTVFVSNKLTAAPVQVIRTVDNNTGEKTVHGNNGTVTCEQYCHGPSSLGWGTGPWNGELPREWNGARCVASSSPDVGCNRAPGNRGGFKCVCEKTGKGW
jgi:hypothetical protein